jgi:hypothetical protein
MIARHATGRLPLAIGDATQFTSASQQARTKACLQSGFPNWLKIDSKPKNEGQP